MAGLGARTWVAGEVVTAANVQGYLQDQTVMVFASATARTSAIASPSEGMITYLKDVDELQVYSGSAWVYVASSVAPGGLVLITETTLNAVTNNISNVFSSKFDSYRVVISELTNSTATTRLLSLRFRNASGDDNTANYFWGYRLYYGVGSAGDAMNAGQTYSELSFVGSGASNGGGLSIDIHNPNLACATVFSGSTVAFQSNVGSYVIRSSSGGINTNTVYTGFSIIGVTDNLSGKVRVYGYRK